jgi:hypothetical protein
MLSMQLFRVILDERERAIQEELRVRRLLQDAADASLAAPPESPRASYRSSWRARTPRASATTR